MRPASDVAASVAAALGFDATDLQPLRLTSDSETWRCSNGSDSVILKRFLRPAAGLSARDRYRKSRLAAEELGAAGLRTPVVMAAADGAAALLFEDVRARPWGDEARRCAAQLLRRLHDASPDDLSNELIGLMDATEPNRGRVMSGLLNALERLDERKSQWRRDEPRFSAEVDSLLASEEPDPPDAEVRLIHGDYFRANLVADDDGVTVLDWDLARSGDPAWDLAFLVAAEAGLDAAERDSVLSAYGPLEPETALRLRWQLRCWDAFWAVRALLARAAT